MSTAPFPRHDEFARVLVFDKQVAEAFRHGVADPAQMRGNVGRHLGYHAGKIAEYWQDRNRKHMNQDIHRKWLRESVNHFRWYRWFYDHLSKPEVIAEIKSGPSREMLHWGEPTYMRGLDRMANKEPTILDNKGRIVAQITKETRRFDVGNVPTIKAWIFARPGATTEPPLNWAMHRTRKAAVKWMVDQLHRRCIKIFGNEIDLPEWKP